MNLAMADPSIKERDSMLFHMKKTILRNLLRAGGSLCAAVLLAGSLHAATPKQVLVVTVTKGFRHSSIPTAEKVLGELANKTGEFAVDYARNDEVLTAKMNAEALHKYDAVIFANTTGDLPLPSPEAFIEWVKSGKAFIGMHSASDTFHGFAPYLDMIAAEFETHHDQATIQCRNEDPNHPANHAFDRTFQVHDEIYLFKRFHRDDVHLLLGLDQHPNTKAPGYYPISWCRQFGQGRIFYTELGHREDVWESEAYQKHILGGIEWALGLKFGDATPQCTQPMLSADEVKQGYIPLFNGVNLDGWHLRNANGNPSWKVENGMLVNHLDQSHHGTDLVSDHAFQDFTIRYEYLVPAGSNSGLYLRGRQEIQILDDNGKEKPEMGSNGAIYSVRPASRMVSRPVGEWQEVEATMAGRKITVTLNGVKIHDGVEVTRATGGQLDDRVGEPGPIMVQGDHGAVAFRNMRIKILN